MMSKLSVFVCTGVAVMVIASACAPAMCAEKTLYRFKGGSDGAHPYGGLIKDKSDNLYGTTGGGGGKNCGNDSEFCGTVFEINKAGKETVLYTFVGGCDGWGPSAGLYEDKSGNLYGTTSAGGTCDNDKGYGTVFKLAPDGSETVLYAFKGGDDGFGPRSNLIMDKKGNLFGTTEFGGSLTKCNDGGCGTVFEVTPNGDEKILYAFQGAADGGGPSGGVIMDKSGNLFGTTYFGGSGGCGTVFEIASDGTESVVYSFQGGDDGFVPVGGVIADSSGNFYGTTRGGGTKGYGSVFKVTPDGAESVLYSFAPGTNGSDPLAGVVMDKSGNLYGTTAGGGIGCKKDGCGTVYELAPDGTETVLYAFKPHDGSRPISSLLMGRKNTLYGTTTEGGKKDKGVVFSVTAK